MPIIDNFSALPENELQKFATELVQKINDEGLFTDEDHFKIVEVQADEMTGDLVIGVDASIEVPRSAEWICYEEDEINDKPEYDRTEYPKSDTEEIKKALKATSVELDGYRVTIEVDDWDFDDITEVSVDTWSEEDAGIGHYEYWGHEGYDSRPYYEVSGTLTTECRCAFTFSVEPINN